MHRPMMHRPMNVSPVPILLILAASISLPACTESKAKPPEKPPKIVVTNPVVKDVVLKQEYVCQIHSGRHIEIRSREQAYLKEIYVKEGQLVQEGEKMFQLNNVLYKAELARAQAELQLKTIHYNNVKRMYEKKVVSEQKLKLAEAEMNMAKAEVQHAQRAVDYTSIEAPYTGIIDHLFLRKGSMVEEGDLLTTLSDNSEMWVYFYVPESRYLKYMAHRNDDDYISSVELELANQEIYPYPGKIVTIEADANNKTGTIPFRADFPNPNRMLRHHETGTIVINHPLHDALVIPQRGTFQILNHRYIYTVDEKGVVHQVMVFVEHQLEDLFVIKKGEGISADDKIILFGIRHVRDGEKISYDYKEPQKVMSDMKYYVE